MSEATENMVNAIADESPTDFEAQFNIAVAAKLSDALAKKKLEIASALLQGDQQTEE